MKIHEQYPAHSHAKWLSIYIRWAAALILREKIVFVHFILKLNTNFTHTYIIQ